VVKDTPLMALTRDAGSRFPPFAEPIPTMQLQIQRQNASALLSRQPQKPPPHPGLRVADAETKP
jgi:hypothetical protein